LAERALPFVAWAGARDGVDLTDYEALRTAFQEARPGIVIHAAALARIADCHRDPERARRVNTLGTHWLADLAAQARARLIQISTDLVFDGAQGHYGEDDPPSPVSVYGRTKADAEPAVLAGSRNAVARLSLLFGPSRQGRRSFFEEQVEALRRGRPVTLFTDEWRTPLGLRAAAAALVDLALSDVTGLLHLGGPQRMSRVEMGQRLAAFLGADASAIQAVERAAVPSAEPRPRDTSLDVSRWRRLFPASPWPDLETSLRADVPG
jgi:dTDP-4-dehydrorhamnose reductase